MTRISMLAFLLSLAPGPAAGAEPAARAPNIILIMADELGYERLASCGSRTYRTPRLDRLAAQGAQFGYCFSTPVCTPTRVMLMTGKYSHRNYAAFAEWPQGERSFANVIAESGYATAVIGKWQLGGASPADLGFGEYCLFKYEGMGSPGSRGRYWHPAIGANGTVVPTTAEDYGPDVFLRYGEDFIRRNADRPFLLYWPMGLIHTPFDATPDGPDPSVRGDHRVVPEMIAYMDKIVGRLVDTVDELGLTEQTLIVFTGDNGSSDGGPAETGEEGKGSMRDSGTHVPLIARWPGTIPANTVRRDLASLCDLYPTLADAAGIEVSGRELDGTSLLPWMKGLRGPRRDWAFMSFKRRWAPPGGTQPVSAWVRDHRWKLYDDGRVYDLELDPDERLPVSGPDADAARRKLRPVFAQVGATPEALARFGARNVTYKPAENGAGERSPAP